jgi:hypothetical protein
VGDTHQEHPLLGNGYRLDLVSVPSATVLRREDGSEVARFNIRDATSNAIERAAQEQALFRPYLQRPLVSIERVAVGSVGRGEENRSRTASDYIHPTLHGGRCRVRVYLPERDVPGVVA